MLPRHQQFVDEYLADPDLNATRAYRKVYPTVGENASRRNASRLLSRADVQAAIAERRKARSLSTQITAERVLLEIARLALADHRKLYHPDGRLKAVHELDDDTAATIASSEVEEESSGTQTVVRIKKIKQWDKREALNMLGKHLGLFLERLKLEGEVKTTPPPQFNPALLADEQLRQLRGLLAAAVQPPAGPVAGAAPPAG